MKWKLVKGEMSASHVWLLEYFWTFLYKIVLKSGLSREI